MKTWIKRTLVGLFGGIALLGTFAAFSHHGHRHGWHQMSEADAAEMKAKVVQRVGSRLDLDEAQKARLGLLADKLREQRNALVGDSTDPRAEFGQMINGSTFDRQRALAIVQAKTGAVQSKGPEVVAAMADFYDSLRPEQQAKVREYLQKRGRWQRG
jgi:periplasmic protein CpxP/Spy